VLAYRRLGFGLHEIADLVDDWPPTQSRTCAGRAAYCWNSATALLPW